MHTFVLSLVLLTLSSGSFSRDLTESRSIPFLNRQTGFAQVHACPDDKKELNTLPHQVLNAPVDLDTEDEFFDKHSPLLDDDEMPFEDDTTLYLEERESASSLDDEEEVPVPEMEIEIPAKHNDDIRCTWSYEYGYQTGAQKRPVTHRTSLRLEWNRFFGGHYYGQVDGKLTLHGPEDHRTRAEETNWLAEPNLREAYLQASFNNLSVKLGKQIVIWAEADSAAVTDVISPRDLSEFLFTPLEDARLGQLLLLGNFYTDTGTWCLFVNPDPQLNKIPESGTAYDTDPFPSDRFSIEEDLPAIEDTEFGFQWKQFFGPSDVAFMAGDLVENQPIYEFKGIGATEKIHLRKTHSRFQLFGITANLGMGNFLWSGELAYKQKRAFQSIRFIEDGGVIQKNTIEGVLGVSYTDSSGIWRLGLEAFHQHILQWEETLQNVREDETVFTSTWEYDLWNETLHLNYRLTLRTQDLDMIHKVKGEYELTDQLQVSLETVVFDIQERDSALWSFRDAHRITASLRYFF